ncbi:MAG TPA: hypothetical protein PK018_06280 [Candidatus Competibacter sp.]|nr:hypothetical protein [Candidatus Competibacteraceae bacterium]HPE71764.1 hypothetical protein [Candidatus Competibacter sp.]HRW67183.1 hypothetical protein [Candidatus Competibacter sp.]
MGIEHFVGRDDAMKRIQDVLTGREAAGGKLTVQSIEGPGGIGKTFLFNNAISRVDLTNRNYLILRIDGSAPPPRSLVRMVARMVDGAEAAAIQDRPSGYYFPSVDRVVKAIETIFSEAVAEFKKRHPDNTNGQRVLLRLLDMVLEAGIRINDAIPITKNYANFHELEKHISFDELEKLIQVIEDIVPLMVSLREEVPWFWERLGLNGSTALRNAIKENACRPLADALHSDLSAILAGYRGKDQFKAAHSKNKGIDRLLLILDDYEMLQKPLGEFLAGHLLPALRSANFQSVVMILGRDQLEATHTAWDQHFKPNLLERIALAPLSRSEMDQLVESYGVRAHDDKERAWRDTQGYPFYVQLWTEEVASGGRSAIMLKRFHDRTTRWLSDREKGWLQHTLFLDEVNIRTLRRMLDDEQQAKEALEWFQCEGSVRDTSSKVFRVREYLRSRLIDYLRVSDPDYCEQLQHRGRLAMNGQC